MLRRDGSAISSNARDGNVGVGQPISASERNRLKKLLSSAIGLHVATIREVYFIDDDKNLSKEHVEYSIRIESGERVGQEYTNVFALNLAGGRVNFSETIYYPITKELKGGELSKNIPKTLHDADEVLVGFLDNRADLPFIIGGVPSSKPFIKGATEEDGQRHVSEYNGVRTLINKDGEYYLMYLGGQRDTQKGLIEGETENSGTAPTIFKMLKDGSFALIDKASNKIKTDTKTSKITISQEILPQLDVIPDQMLPEETNSQVINSIEMDGLGKITTNVGIDGIVKEEDGLFSKTSKTYRPGLKITEDGLLDKVEVTTATGVKTTVSGLDILIELDALGITIKVDGTTRKITLATDTAEVEIDGLTGKIALKGTLVDIGAAASSFAALGPELLSWLATHTHISTSILAPSPSSPPIVPPTVDLLSATVKVQK